MGVAAGQHKTEVDKQTEGVDAMKSFDPRVYFNGSQDDRLAIRMLNRAKIPFVPIGPTSLEPTPYLEYGSWRFEGLKSISRFVKAWNSRSLPPLDQPITKK